MGPGIGYCEAGRSFASLFSTAAAVPGTPDNSANGSYKEHVSKAGVPRPDTYPVLHTENVSSLNPLLPTIQQTSGAAPDTVIWLHKHFAPKSAENRQLPVPAAVPERPAERLEMLFHGPFSEAGSTPVPAHDSATHPPNAF